MCGIVYVQRKDGRPAARTVLNRFRKQRTRGTEGFGYVAIRDNKVESYQRAETEKEIVALLTKETAPEILFHHRMPTSTPNYKESAHPLLVAHTTIKHAYFVVHNGVIHNSHDLRTKHRELGFSYKTEVKSAHQTRSGKVYPLNSVQWNDSEALAIETALVLEEQKNSIDTVGPAAVVALKIRDNEVVGRFFFRNMANPLKLYSDTYLTAICSEGAGEILSSLYLLELTERGMVEVSPLVTPPPSYRVSAPQIGFKYPTSESGMDRYGLPGYVKTDSERDWQEWAKTHPRKSLPAQSLKKSVLTSLNLDELWAEYDITLSLQAAWRTKMTELESKGKRVTAEDVLQRQHLQTLWDNADEYNEEILNRINYVMYVEK